MSLQDIVNEASPRSQYTKEILRQLDNFSMNEVVNFHLMNDRAVIKKNAYRYLRSCNYSR